MSAKSDSNPSDSHIGPRLARRVWAAYAAALLLSTGVVLLRYAAAPWAGDRPILIVFVLPIILSAYLGGTGPGVVATVIVGLGTTRFIMTSDTPFSIGRPVDFVQWVVLLSTGVANSWLIGRLHRAGQRTAASLAAWREAEELLLIEQRNAEALLDFSRRAEHADDMRRLVEAAQIAVSRVLGLHSIWMALLSEDGESIELLSADPRTEDRFTHDAPARFQIKGDAMLEAIVSTQEMVVVDDARHDPRPNPEVVRRLGSRTIINVPILLLGKTLGTLGTGTFGDEGVRLLSQAEREFLRALASHAAVSVNRIDALDKIRQGQEALRKSEERLGIVIENLTEGLVLSEMDGKLLHWNKAALVMHGFANSEEWCLMLPDFISIFEMSTLDGVVLPFDRWPMPRIFRGEVLQSLDLRIRRIGESWERIFSYGGRIVRDGMGKDIAFLTMMDITMRKSSEDRVAYQAHLLANVNDAILAVDAGFRINAWNAAAELLYGWKAEEVIGHDALELLKTDFSGSGVDETRAKIAAAGSWRGNATQMRKDGCRIPVEIATIVLKRDGGDITGFVSVVRDLSEVKRAEQERQQLETQFRQSQKMEAVGLLAGGVAHDFNNMLTIISGNCELLYDRVAMDPRSHAMLDQIRSAGERAAGLTRQLLAFSRRQVLNPKVIDINNIVADTEKMLHRLLGEDIQLATNLARKLNPVTLDEGHLSQVIVNLAVNARDAMPTGGKLTLQTANAQLDDVYSAAHNGVVAGNYVMLAISDTGTGIAPEILDRVFDPFFTTKKLGEGTGLGLSVVHGIVTQSGGRIEVYSEPAHGTTFKIYFPAVPQDTTPTVTPLPANGIHGHETILVAEDEDGVRQLAVRGLLDFGYTVIEANCGAKALELLDGYHGHIDLLFTDVVMPGMSGRELAEAVQQRLPDIKIIFTSGYTDDAIVRHGILTAEVSFLQKPYTPLTLLRRIREILDRP